MPRPQRCRRVCEEPEFNSFSPDGIPNNTCITLTVDEYEVIRLVDLEQLNHAQAAEKMNISAPPPGILSTPYSIIFSITSS